MTIPHNLVRGALRKVWMYSSQARKEVKLQARILRGLYRCGLCGLGTHKPEIDHIEPVGPAPGSRLGQGVSWDGWMRRLFCPVEGLMVLCEKCHEDKTTAQRQDTARKALNRDDKAS